VYNPLHNKHHAKLSGDVTSVNLQAKQQKISVDSRQEMSFAGTGNRAFIKHLIFCAHYKDCPIISIS
jgi:hypothetical protein